MSARWREAPGPIWWSTRRIRWPISKTRRASSPFTWPETRSKGKSAGKRSRLNHLFHGPRKRVDLFEGCVDIRRDPQALVFAGRHDGHGPDAVLRPEVGGQLHCV